eukprot:15336409-Ditylum_brightwellii.AAC.1
MESLIVVIIRRLWILQQHKISEIISKRSRGGRMRYLILLTGQLTNAVKTDYIIIHSRQETISFNTNQKK